MRATTIGERIDRATDMIRLVNSVLREQAAGGRTFMEQQELATALLRVTGPIEEDLAWTQKVTQIHSTPAPTDDEREELAARRQARKLAAVDGGAANAAGGAR